MIETAPESAVAPDVLSWLGPWQADPGRTPREHRRSAYGPLFMKQYRVIGFDVKDERLFDVAVEAPNQTVAWVMAFAQMCRNFATVPLADRTNKLIACLREK
jgi:hypothetical protein